MTIEPSPVDPEELRRRNRRLGSRLALVALGLALMAAAYIVIYARYFKGEAG